MADYDKEGNMNELKIGETGFIVFEGEVYECEIIEKSEFLNYGYFAAFNYHGQKEAAIVVDYDPVFITASRFYRDYNEALKAANNG